MVFEYKLGKPPTLTILGKTPLRTLWDFDIQVTVCARAARGIENFGTVRRETKATFVKRKPLRPSAFV